MIRRVPQAQGPAIGIAAIKKRSGLFEISDNDRDDAGKDGCDCHPCRAAKADSIRGPDNGYSIALIIRILRQQTPAKSPARDHPDHDVGLKAIPPDKKTRDGSHESTTRDDEVNLARRQRVDTR